MPDLQSVPDVADAVSESRPMGWLARVGLTARGCVYVLLGVLAVVVGLGGRAHVDQKGALTEVVSRPFGGVLVALLAVGLAAYAVWRLSEAATGVVGEGGRVGPRLQSLVRGLVYTGLAVTAVSVLLGARGTQAGQQGSLAREVMQHPGGRWAVGLVGAVVLVVGVVMVREGWSKKFMRYFGYLPVLLRTSIVRLGQVGTVCRGTVFAIAGFLVVLAAWNADPEKAGGVDEAFKTLLQQPFGPALVVVLGLGLVVFGVYGLAEARWRRVTDHVDGP